MRFSQNIWLIIHQPKKQKKKIEIKTVKVEGDIHRDKRCFVICFNRSYYFGEEGDYIFTDSFEI